MTISASRVPRQGPGGLRLHAEEIYIYTNSRTADQRQGTGSCRKRPSRPASTHSQASQGLQMFRPSRLKSGTISSRQTRTTHRRCLTPHPHRLVQALYRFLTLKDQRRSGLVSRIPRRAPIPGSASSARSRRSRGPQMRRRVSDSPSSGPLTTMTRR